ncbi:hypothetical protein [Microvirga pudoricolor]|uniref:hypothetical protein n=1 Tax=Microvirga pudoricolor TaxID=2778729 RepID=UPI0019508C26|nr:hypothetical protein [Microvirga pudoricolor]MBM6596087.1 hypothetical protein [Microvirga pudoricolor]
MAQDAKPDMKPDAKAEMSKSDMSKSDMSKPEMGKSEMGKSEMGKPAKDMSAAQAALRERQKTCGAEWKTVKAAGKAEPGMKWPKFWSACNTRLKGEKKA